MATPRIVGGVLVYSRRYPKYSRPTLLLIPLSPCVVRDWGRQESIRYSHLAVCRSQNRYNFFKAYNLPIAKFPRPSSHTSNTVDKLNKSKLSGLVNVFTLVLPGMLVVLLLLPLSLAMDNGEFDHGGGGGGGGGPVAAAAVAVAAMDNDWRQKRPATRASTVA